MNSGTQPLRNISRAADDLEKDWQSLAGDLLQPFHLRTASGAGLLPASPDPEAVILLVDRARKILFPGYLEEGASPPDRLQKKLELHLQAFYNILNGQINLMFPPEGRSAGNSSRTDREAGHEKTRAFFKRLPTVKTQLLQDIQAAYEGDPAAKSCTEIIVSYPGFFAVTVYRIAHALHLLGIPLLPRMMTEYAHSRTGIDIHPGAEIGEAFFIDHGTGVVIGETTTIGNRVRLYQGVTLGALSLPPKAGDLFRNKKRHPTIEDDVIIYANATILGGETVIGAGSVIGGNVWLTESVPPGTRVMLDRPDLVYLKN
ncbi:MAG: serine acetyltransferase [Deltaproteobacteria bacterium]|nr:serine acetyltransferase [Deltaproteobacteria bacterium]